jgi:hypothetical protein
VKRLVEGSPEPFYRTAGWPRPQRSHAGSCQWLPGRRAL